MPKSNLFIVGAPKAGTTSLYQYLQAHPDVFLSPRKEPQYFGADLIRHAPDDYTFPTTEAAYLNLFRRARGQTIIGEASTSYFFSTQAAEEIRAFQPDAKIIIMLRHPVDMMYSQYYQGLALGEETAETFEQALELEPLRQAGEFLPATAFLPNYLFYRHNAHLCQHVKRYLDVFGRQQVHIILFDDFQRDPAQVYRAVLVFLGIAPDFQPRFTQHNPTSQARSGRLQNFLRQPPKPLLEVGKRTLVISRPIFRAIRRLNQQPIDKVPLSPATREILQAEFRDDIVCLGELIERDLSAWLG